MSSKPFFTDERLQQIIAAGGHCDLMAQDLQEAREALKVASQDWEGAGDRDRYKAALERMTQGEEPEWSSECACMDVAKEALKDPLRRPEYPTCDTFKTPDPLGKATGCTVCGFTEKHHPKSSVDATRLDVNEALKDE